MPVRTKAVALSGVSFGVGAFIAVACISVIVFFVMLMRQQPKPPSGNSGTAQSKSDTDTFCDENGRPRSTYVTTVLSTDSLKCGDSGSATYSGKFGFSNSFDAYVIKGPHETITDMSQCIRACTLSASCAGCIMRNNNRCTMFSPGAEMTANDQSMSAGTSNNSIFMKNARSISFAK